MSHSYFEEEEGIRGKTQKMRERRTHSAGARREYGKSGHSASLRVWCVGGGVTPLRYVTKKPSLRSAARLGEEMRGNPRYTRVDTPFALRAHCVSVVRQEGFEPPTLGSEDRCSIP